LLHKLRQALRSRAIKLWEPPYTSPDSGSAPDAASMQSLAESLSQNLRLCPSACAAALENLRQQTLDNAESLAHFRATQEATLKVRLPRGQNPQLLRIRCSLQSTGYQFKSLIVARAPQLSMAGVSLICNGRVLDDALSLGNQGVQHNNSLMLLVRATTDDVQNLRASADDADALREAETEAGLLAGEEDDGLGSASGGSAALHVTNQRGEKINLPREHRKALYYAMILGEKGKAALRSNQHGRALLLLLAADEAFNRVDRSLLDRVDNHALLQLDTVWCYLCLGRLDELGDAWDRLGLAERALVKAYGEQLERVEAVKGTSAGGERIHLLRLHLLKAMCCFYSNRLEEAAAEARLASAELDKLAVDDAGLSSLMGMGFSLLESRLALRHCANDTQAAIDWIVARRERQRTQAAERKLQRRLGYLDDGETRVSAASCLRLTEMGYLESHAHEALVLTRNSIDAALTLLQDDQDRLQTLADQRYNSRLQLVLDTAASSGIASADAQRLSSKLYRLIGAKLEALNRRQQRDPTGNHSLKAQQLLIGCIDELLEDEQQQKQTSEASDASPSSAAASSSVPSSLASWTTTDSDEGEAATAMAAKIRRVEQEKEAAEAASSDAAALREASQRQRRALDKLRDEVGDQDEEAYLDSDLQEERRQLDRLLAMLGN
ncbi:hypothetical protein BOX15_Mlig018107g1, partial [Macrostomum lignano]